MKPSKQTIGTLVLGSILFLGSTVSVSAAPPLRPYAAEPGGRVFLTAPDESRVYSVAPDGSVETVAGPKVLLHPTGLSLRSDGVLFIAADSGLYRLNPGSTTPTLVRATHDPAGPSVPYIKITSPSPASQWTMERRMKIRWAHNLGPGALFRVELSRDGGESWETLADTVKGNSFVWTVDLPETATARLKVTQVPDSNARMQPVSDSMDDVFAMFYPSE